MKKSRTIQTQDKTVPVLSLDVVDRINDLALKATNKLVVIAAAIQPHEDEHDDLQEDVRWGIVALLDEIGETLGDMKGAVKSAWDKPTAKGGAR